MPPDLDREQRASVRRLSQRAQRLTQAGLLAAPDAELVCADYVRALSGGAWSAFIHTVESLTRELGADDEDVRFFRAIVRDNADLLPQSRPLARSMARAS